jgi:hypothetical protein
MLQSNDKKEDEDNQDIPYELFDLIKIVHTHQLLVV